MIMKSNKLMMILLQDKYIEWIEILKRFSSTFATKNQEIKNLIINWKKKHLRLNRYQNLFFKFC